MNAKEIADTIHNLLMTRAGEPITADVARERANNIACVVMMWIDESNDNDNND